MSTLPNGWKIERNPKSIPSSAHDFDFWHENYDGENGLCGTAESVEDAIEQINEMEAA